MPASTRIVLYVRPFIYSQNPKPIRKMAEKHMRIALDFFFLRQAARLLLDGVLLWGFFLPWE